MRRRRGRGLGCAATDPAVAMFSRSKPIDPRDGKPGNMTQRSSLTEKERKERMRQPPPDASKPRQDLLPRSGKATYSTVMQGRGLGILDWVPHRPQVARRWEWEPPDEPAADAHDDTCDSSLTTVETVFLRYGRTAPRWMVRTELRYRAHLAAREHKEKKKKKAEQKPDEDSIQTLPVPDSVSGMLLQKAKETSDAYTSGVRSHIEYQRRLRQIEGPSPFERMVFDHIYTPIKTIVLVIFLHVSAYWRVNEGFARRKARTGDSEGKTKVTVATWRQLELLQHRIQTIAALVAFISVIIAVLVNELQFRGFIPGRDEDCANPNAPTLTCKPNPGCTYVVDNSTGPLYVGDTEVRYRLVCEPPDVNEFGFIDRLKLINTALTGFLVFTEYFYYRYEANIFSIRNHTEFSDPQLKTYWLHQCGLLKWYMVECICLAIHQIPFYYSDIIIQTSYFSSRPSVYSVDGIFALFMTNRFFQVWKWYRGFLYTRFASRRYAIRLNDEDTGSLLAIRLFVLDNPVTAFTHFFLVVIFMGSFIYRVAESSVNDIVAVYYWDCMWFMVDAMTGLPDPKDKDPQGTFGRGIAVLVRILGLVWFILVLFAVRQWRKNDAAETAFFGWLRLSSLNIVRRISAARVIQYSVLYGMGHWSTLRQLDRFRVAQQKVQMAQKEDKDLDGGDFEVFKRSLGSRVAEMKQMVLDFKQAVDKEEGGAPDGMPRSGSEEKNLDHLGTTTSDDVGSGSSPMRVSRTVSGAGFGGAGAFNHSTDMPVVNQMTSKRPFACHICGKAYAGAQSLRFHSSLASCANGFTVARSMARQEAAVELSDLVVPYDDTAQVWNEKEVGCGRGVHEGADALLLELTLQQELQFQLQLQHELQQNVLLKQHLHLRQKSDEEGGGYREAQERDDAEVTCQFGTGIGSFREGAIESSEEEKEASSAWQEIEEWMEGDELHEMRGSEQHMVIMGQGTAFGYPFTRGGGKVAHSTSPDRLPLRSRAENDLTLQSVSDVDLLPGQVTLAGARSTGYSSQSALRHADRRLASVAGARFGEGQASGVDTRLQDVRGVETLGGGSGFRITEQSRARKKGVQFADIDSPRAKPGKIGIVGGDINYSVILSAKEKQALQAKTLQDQVQKAVTEMRDLRVHNDELLRTFGLDPAAVDIFGNELEEETEEREPETWERDMMAALERAEQRFSNVDATVSQIMVSRV